MPRILAFTDPHGKMEAAESLIAIAGREKPDLLISPGDISYFETGYLRYLERLSDLGREIYFVPGNHEREWTVRAITDRFPFMKELTYTLIEAAGVRMVGLPGWGDYWPGERSEGPGYQLAIGLWGKLDRSMPLVLVTHFPPTRTKVSGMTVVTPDSGGTAPVRKLIEVLEPALVLTGHYHQDFGKEDAIGRSRIVNPGPGGMLIEI